MCDVISYVIYLGWNIGLPLTITLQNLSLGRLQSNGRTIIGRVNRFQRRTILKNAIKLVILIGVFRQASVALTHWVKKDSIFFILNWVAAR